MGTYTTTWKAPDCEVDERGALNFLTPDIVQAAAGKRAAPYFQWFVDATDTTIYVPPNATLRRDEFHNYILTLEPGGSA